MLHVGYRSSRVISCYSHRACSVHNFATAAAILKRNKLLAELSIITIWIYHLVFVVTGYRSHVLHRLRLMVLGLLLMLLREFMAIYDRRDPIILMIVC